jgi:hypothetical protein
VNTLKYLGRQVGSIDEDWPALYNNLNKTWGQWGSVSQVLLHEGHDKCTSGMFYKVVAQSVPLYDCETCVITPTILRRLDAFHRRIVRWLTGRAPYLQEDTGTWVYPPFGNALDAAGFYMIFEYILRRRATLVDYAASTSLLKLCQDTPKPDGFKNRLFWWDQSPFEKLKTLEEIRN